MQLSLDVIFPGLNQAPANASLFANHLAAMPGVDLEQVPLPGNDPNKKNASFADNLAAMLIPVAALPPQGMMPEMPTASPDEPSGEGGASLGNASQGLALASTTEQPLVMTGASAPAIDSPFTFGPDQTAAIPLPPQENNPHRGQLVEDGFQGESPAAQDVQRQRSNPTVPPAPPPTIENNKPLPASNPGQAPAAPDTLLPIPQPPTPEAGKDTPRPKGFIPTVDQNSALDNSPSPASVGQPAVLSAFPIQEVQPEAAASSLPVEYRTQAITPARKIRNASPERPEANEAAAPSFSLNAGQAIQHRPTISDQLKDAIISRLDEGGPFGRTEIHLRLDPPELGTVRIHLTSSAAEVSGRFVVQNDAAKGVLETQMNTLRDRLNDAGIHLGRFDVTREGMNHPGHGQRDPRGSALDEDTWAVRSPNALKKPGRAASSVSGWIDVLA